MTFKTSVLASAVMASLALGAGAQAATPAALVSQVFPSGTTTAVFNGGATVNNGESFVSSVLSDQKAGIIANLTPAAGDVGKEGDFYMVINTGTSWLMRTPTGWTNWDTRVPSLVPFATKSIAATESINIADLEASAGQQFDGKTLRVHVGYMSDTSPLLYSSAIQFRMENPIANPGTCPVGPAEGLPSATPGGKKLCVLSGSYTSDIRLNNNFEYILSGGVFIGGDNVNSASITIDPGVKIYGEKGLDFLVINRGSRIHANGTKDQPITFTSANDATANASTSGQWGGIIINGNAPINGCTAGTAVCEASGEGSTGLYGGNNPNDSSGNLNYVVVKYAGYLITPTNELNGIAFQGVGSGTVVDYVQVHNNSDDGVEFFGGTVNAKHLYLTGNEDDSLDWTFGWSGKVQHVIIQQRDIGDKAIEADNNATNRDSLPRSMPTIANMTIIGNPNAGGGILLREGTGAKIVNSIISGADKFCVNIDHPQTYAVAGPVNALTGNLAMTNTTANCAISFKDDSGDTYTVTSWFSAQTGNSTAAVGMTNYVNTSAANALPVTTGLDSFFDVTNYRGAVKDTASDWTAGWTFKP